MLISSYCNPTWDEIRELLSAGQSPSDRHDLIARVLKQKLKSPTDFIVKRQVFVGMGCRMLFRRMAGKRITACTHSDLVNRQNYARPNSSSRLGRVTKNMIHGPCGAFNSNPPSMKDGKCTK